ncbi:DUF3379 family protein [Niveibacterium sp. SC-1]|uniref:DUF3379 family protein n=1 Tax=Niveibacterium sp. SC-1 TaxID=3135646 RepID=UPI00311DCCE5
MTPQENMNCLDFRRAKLADPYRLNVAAQAHGNGCTNCQSFALRVDREEEQYARALAVPVPEGLNDRLVLAVRGQRRTSWQAWAMAASLVAAVGIGFAAWRFEQPALGGAPQLVSSGAPMAAIHHVLDEPEALRASYEIPIEEFQAVLAGFGAKMMAPVGKVVLIKRCPGPEGEGWHIVIDGPQGRITLLLFPGTQVRKPMMARMNGMEAITEPGGRGYYAVVATNANAAEYFTRMLRDNIRWQI